MQIVIEISEEDYEELKSDTKPTYYEDLILQGTPLPEHHGDLIDRNELLKQPMNAANYPSNYVRIAKAIIPATKEEKIDCGNCVNQDDELSGECYECLKGMFNHYEPATKEGDGE